MSHVSEYEVENIFLDRLESIGYKFVKLNNYEDVLANFRGQLAIFNAKKLEEKALPSDLDYSSISGLRLEAREKLSRIKPLNLGQAGRISGVNPADVAVLMVYLAERKKNR